MSTSTINRTTESILKTLNIDPSRICPCVINGFANGNRELILDYETSTKRLIVYIDGNRIGYVTLTPYT